MGITVDYIESNVEKIPFCGCWFWIKSLNNKGYGYSRKTSSGSLLAHRASYEIFIGEIPEKMCVLHRCDNPSCVNPDHLFLGTMKQNTTDMTLKGRDGGRFEKGSLGHSANFTKEQVLSIRSSTKKTKVLASTFSVHRTIIQRIRSNNPNRRTYGCY